MAAVESDIKQFVSDNFLFGNDEQLGEDESFLESGVIDSTGVLELVTFLESRFTISVDDDELVPDNLDSVNRLIAFVERKVRELEN